MAEITCIQNNIYGSFTFEATSGYKIKEITRQEIDELSPTTLYKAKETSEYLEVFTDLTCENYCIYTYKITSSSGTIYVFDNKQVEFEDIILCDAAAYNLVRFNPSLSSVKINQSETIITTLGGRYPIVRRNAATNYYSFSLGGLISIRAENDTCELTYPSVDEYYQELGYRRQFVEFLTNGKVKLFKSPTEGAFLVRVTGVSLTPEAKLDRRICSFSATVTEVAEVTPSNCVKYNIYSLKAISPQFITSKGVPFYVQQEG